MIPPAIYVTIALACIAGAGVYMVMLGVAPVNHNGLTFRMKGRYNAEADEEEKEEKWQKLFFGTDINISRKTYRICRLAPVLLLSAAGIAAGNIIWISLSVIIFTLSAPITQIAGFTTPFGLILAEFRKSRSNKLKNEIYNGTGYIRNRVASGESAGLTTDMLLEELIDYSVALAPHYSRMLSLVRMNERERAAEEFADNVGADIAADYARMIIRIDEIAPKQMYSTLLSYQKSIVEERITKLKKRDEMMSDLMYLPVMLCMFLIFFNFLYISYFMQQSETLQSFFNVM